MWYTWSQCVFYAANPLILLTPDGFGAERLEHLYTWKWHQITGREQWKPFPQEQVL